MKNNLITRYRSYRRSLSGVLTLFTFMGSMFTSPAVAAEWVRVKTDAQNNAYYVDVSAIERSGNLRSFWSNVIHGQPSSVEGKLVYSTTYYIIADCENQIYIVQFERLLDENGQTLQDYAYGDSDNVGTPRPGSPEEASLKFVCSK